jgi:UDP-glucose 4-epimerase
MSKCIVTGGAGFIGSNLTDKLIELGHEVVVIDNLSTGEYANVNKKAYFHKTDLHTINISDLHPICKDAEYIFHMAALPSVQYSIEQPLHAAKINLLSTLNILEYARTHGVKKFIYSGSCSCYGNAEEIPTTEDESIKPLSPYALHKYQGEEYCRLYNEVYGLDTVVLRYFNVYGPRMTNTGAYRSVLSVFLDAYNKKKPFNIVNDGEQRRDFVHVFDVVNANIGAIESGNVSAYPINIGSGTNYSVNEIVDMFGAEKKYGEKRIEPYETLADIMAAKVLLHWVPKVELENWIKEQL